MCGKQAVLVEFVAVDVRDAVHVTRRVHLVIDELVAQPDALEKIRRREEVARREEIPDLLPVEPERQLAAARRVMLEAQVEALAGPRCEAGILRRDRAQRGSGGG